MDDAPNEGIDKAVEHLPLAEKTSSDNGLNRTPLHNEDRFENVPKWFTGDATGTIEDRDPLAIFAAAMVAATSAKALVTHQTWKEACLKELGDMKENEIFSLVRLPAGKRAVGCRWVFTMKDGPTGEFAKTKLVPQGFT